MGGLGGPHPGVVVFYENVKAVITDGKVRIVVTLHDGSEKVTVVIQKTGEVEA